MNILLVEKDENNLKLMLQTIAENYAMAQIEHCSTNENLKTLLCSGVAFDLALCEVELVDGLIFEVFQEIHPSFPVVFMSAYDKYWSQAMIFNALDYLRKPIGREEILRVFDKYDALKNHFLKRFSADNVSKNNKSVFQKDRLIAKKGTNYYVIPTQNIAFIYTESRIVFLIDQSGERYTVERSLSDLEVELPSRDFFRVNRKFIVHINAILSFKPSFKGKIALELMHLAKAEVSISQENATQFKKWIEE
ncbi:two component transcriptional regulator, LytTR family [Emticicia oligotrophica DSM 17448]|jgi:DNA-binding LytR/AlgR family response regulator|uniref:Two component transcriptional regulator, LytTR family n=1 Tax=Emticicia oligotrophica (strain DSM 17448 / CIP 109782 / MTCC 6937 / GPTSA100-15) TaxID=929562 RepID=A0ABM5MY15_EMTOG|nr:MULTISPECIES: LytTR family DNA-binding domain-containing protein [Emticicia]AFK02051.1 two component transcriptional regulator, LytTR family [Emticicia oligotrophica DSM 17448]